MTEAEFRAYLRQYERRVDIGALAFFGFFCGIVLGTIVRMFL